MEMKKHTMLLVCIVIIGTLCISSMASASTVLKVGSYGSEVRVMQTNLQTLGYNVGAIDGIFGQITKAAVISFQRDQGILDDGIVGPVTTQVLSRATVRQKTTYGIIASSKQLIGIPYAWGGTTPAGFDCSGFTKYVFASQGITLPRISNDQYGLGIPVSYKNLLPGDLVFFSPDYNGKVSHVGIYIGSGQFINATTNNGITISSFTSYWQNCYVGTKRVY